MAGFSAKTMRYKIPSNIQTASEKEGLLAFVFSYVKRSLKNMFRFSKAELIALLVFIILWAATGILKVTNPSNTNSILNAIAYLTASYNGLQQGTLSIVGGIFAKSTVYFLIAGTFIPSIANVFKGNLKQEFKGISQFFKQLIKIRPNNLSQLSMLALGIGLALVMYNFLSVDGSFQNNFVSILLAISLIGQFGDKSTFTVGFLSQLFKKSANKSSATATLQMGLIFGFTLSIPLALNFSNIKNIGFIIGGAAILLGIALTVVARSSKKEAN